MKSKTPLYLLFIPFFQNVICQMSYEDILTHIDLKAKPQLSLQCQRDLDRIAFSTSTFWLMVDSSSRIPSGIGRGNISPMGNYDECLEISEVETKFCSTSLTLNVPFDFSNMSAILTSLRQIDTNLVYVPPERSGIGLSFYYCVLKSCSAQDLNTIFDGFIRFDDDRCFSKDSEPPLDTLAIVAIIIFALIALITVASTSYDVYLQFNDSAPFHKTVIAFSLYTNGKKLFHLGNSQQLQCLNGIKSITMLWVVLSHVYLAYAYAPLDNYLEGFQWLKSAYSQYISGATVSVDTFFVVGGFLTMYIFQTTMDKGIKFNLSLYYFHRFLRLTPALAAMILAHAALFNYLGSGPVWQRTDIFLSKICRKYWWSALLYVQNYANPNEACVPQSWYLSIDMQMFFISPALLILMRQWPLCGYITLSVVSLLSIVGSFLVGWFYKLCGQVTANLHGTYTDYMTYYYVPTHTRIAPYLCGIMLGYAVYKYKASGRKACLNTNVVILGWLLSLGLMATCLYSGHTIQTSDYDRVANSFYLALIRPTWGIAICWIIFTCLMGYGGPVNKFLSLPVFQILSRLCYSIYLVHYSFIFMTTFATRSPSHFSDYNAFHKFCGDLACSVVISVLWTLVFESPIIAVEKVLLEEKLNKKPLSA